MPSKKNGEGSRACPRCRRKTLSLTPHVAVLTTTAEKWPEADGEDRRQRLRYETAWICRNITCKYVRLIRAK